MYTLENIMLKKSLLTFSAAALMVVGFASQVNASSEDSSKTMSRTAVDGGAYYKTTNGKYEAYRVNAQKINIPVKGRAPTANEIRAWNVDMRPDGDGIPEFDVEHGSQKPLVKDGKKVVAEGNVEWGNELYDAQCAMCHGDFGAGGKGGYPTLSGGDISSLSNQLLDPADKVQNTEPPVKNIGSYWPYASTLLWYIKDAMPYPHPKSLTNSEAYSITAYLLYENGIKMDGVEMDEETVLNKANFLTIEMPNKDGFYPNVDTKNPQDGVDNITNFLADATNYGAGVRCMTDCIKGEIPVLKINAHLEGIVPSPSTVRDLPPKKQFKAISEGQKLYELSCVGCHATDALGAPVVGDKEAWHEMIEDRGVNGIYDNAINGINGMPPKGGNMELTDDQMKRIVDYMLNSSK